jgi:hypothetical protein
MSPRELISTLATKDDLKRIARKVDIAALQRLVEQSLREARDHRTLTNLQLQTPAAQLQPLAGVPGILGDIVGLLQRLVERVEALETPEEGE